MRPPTHPPTFRFTHPPTRPPTFPFAPRRVTQKVTFPSSPSRAALSPRSIASRVSFLGRRNEGMCVWMDE